MVLLLTTLPLSPYYYYYNASKAAYATSLPNQCALKTVQPLGQPRSSRAAHPKSAKREVTFEISTAEVDPDYLLSFKTRTISVPEFEEFIQRQHNATDTKVVRTLCKFDSRSSCSISISISKYP